MTSLQFDDAEMMYLLTDISCRKETEITKSVGSVRFGSVTLFTPNQLRIY